MKLSNCCSAKIIEETDICSKCKEHCDTIEQDEEEIDEVLVMIKINNICWEESTPDIKAKKLHRLFKKLLKYGK